MGKCYFKEDYDNGDYMVFICSCSDTEVHISHYHLNHHNFIYCPYCGKSITTKLSEDPNA